MRSDILNKLRTEIERRAEAQKAQIESEANMLCLCAEMLLGNWRDQGETATPAPGEKPAQSASSSPEPEPYLTIEQVARILGEKVDTIYAKAGRGQIPHHKLGSGRKAALKFRYSEIVEWSKRNAEAIQEQKRSPKRKSKLRLAS